MTGEVNVRVFYVYLVTNLVNGKFYVGKSSDPQGRWGDHRKVALGGKEKYPTEFFAVHAAMHKYGLDNFAFRVIDQFDSEKESFEAETQWILKLRSNIKEFGYNCNIGGEGGIAPNVETIQKLVAAQNRPHIKKMKSDLMRERHQANPRFLGKLQAKLTESQVLEIRRKYEYGGFGYLKLAKEFNVSQNTIRKIISRKTWSHI